MKHIIRAAAAILCLSTVTQAQATVKEEKPGMFKLAKVTPDAATATALARVPNGKVKSAMLEMEKKKLIYSFDIKVEGKSGVEEIAVDAMTGAIIGTEHETDADEAKEAKAEKAKAATVKPAAKPPVPPVKKP